MEFMDVDVEATRDNEDVVIPKVNVGPFNASNVSDYVRAVTVAKNGIPVILHQTRMKMVDGVEQKQERYAVMLPPTKNVGVVCAGCYDKNISLWNPSQCVSPRTFANHLDTMPNPDPNGNPIRKRECMARDSLDDCVKRVNGGGGDHGDKTNKVKLDEVSDSDLIYELSRRGLGEIGVAGASFEQLEAEMRRLASGITRKKFYDPRKFGKDPNFLDDPVITWKDMAFAVYERMYGGSHK
jgi:hypothetical protein